MRVDEKYISKSDNDKIPGGHLTKVELTNDAYAICEFIDQLIIKMEQMNGRRRNPLY